MKDGYSRERTSAYIWLISVIAAAFVVELFLLSPRWPAGQALVDRLVLTPAVLRGGHVWQLLTHALIHDSTRPYHILFVLCSVYFLGRELNPVLGSRRLLAVFVAAILAGGLAWSAMHWTRGFDYFGATAGVLGLLVIWAGVFPDSQVSFVLIPVSFRPRTFVWVLVGLEVVGLVLYEILGAPAPLQMAPSAHLGGMLAGWIYFRFFHVGAGWDSAPASLLKMPAWLRRTKQSKAPVAGYRVNLNQRSGLRSEVDRILDKINSHGFGSLTAEEKRVLDEAKDLLSRH